MEAQSAGVLDEQRGPELPGGMIGRCCGGYRITRLLGEGGMGQVYLGSNEHLGKKAAIKVLLPSHSVRMRAEGRFLQEARAAAQIDDPNIVDILDASEFSDGRFYILMPFIEGGSLDELCERMGPLPLEVAAEILLQVCGGLDAAHRHGIVHRDIKPQNILVGPRQQRQYFATIVDFGIAKLLDADMAVGVHTESKAMMGTPGYMAPEQARGSRDIDARVDVYALGTVAYRILTGRTPYLDETLYGLIEKQITNAPFPAPRELRPNIPPIWEQAILAALTIDRSRRLASVRELAEMIARGIPKGDSLVRTLVPQFAGPALPPDALPVSGVIGEGQTVRLPSHAAPTLGSVELPPRRGRKAAGFAFALAAACGVGSLVTYAAMVDADAVAADVSELADASTSERSGERDGDKTDAGAPQRPELASVGDAAPPAADAARTDAPPVAAADPPVVAKTPSTDEKPQATATTGSSVAVSPATKRAAPESPTQPPPSPTPVTPASPAPTQNPSAEAARKSRVTDATRPGAVVVRVKSWARVSINDQPVGYAPVRRDLPPGQYKISLTKDDQQEVLQIMVSPGKTATVERSW